MITYIALLRGINVSGQKIIKMDHLKSVFESMGFHNVRTYIQSGNVLFDATEENAESLTSLIERKIETAYSFPVTVILRTIHELREVVMQNPYRMDELQVTDSFYVSFLTEVPTEAAIAQCLKFRNDIDEFIVKGREVYVLIHKSYGETKFSNNFLEKKLKVAASTRNWATVNKLLIMGQG